MQVVRFSFIFAVGLGASMCQAVLTAVTTPEEVGPTESVYLGQVIAYQEGVSPSGVRYRILHNEGQDGYNSRYIGSGAPHDSVRIEFDQPLAAVGAQVMVSGFTALSATPPDETDPYLYVNDSGYDGVVDNSGGIREITLVTDSGPMAISRIDLRPVPVAREDSIGLFENSTHAFDAGLILRNDLHADGAVLVAAPLHASLFELHADGTFIYRPAKDYSGLDSFIYRATNGNGATSSEPASVTIRVSPVNCPPNFMAGPDLTCKEDDGLQTISRWATNMSSGPESEAPQIMNWEVQTSDDSLFSSVPALNANGDLVFQPAPGKSGVAVVSVRLHDNGGTESGGQDTSAAQEFRIGIEPREHAPLLDPIFDCAVRQGDALILRARANESDPSTAVSYSLDAAPSSATVDSLSGQILWRPGPSDSGMHDFIVRATESGPESLSTTAHFRVEVLEPARPPVLDPVPDIKADPGSFIRVRIASTSTANTRFFLSSSVPGAQLNPGTGVFSWQPTVSQAGRVFQFAVSAVDMSAPGLCTVRTFAVRVSPAISKSGSREALAKNRGLSTSGQAAMTLSSKH